MNLVFGLKEDLGSEVALCFIAHVQAESSQSHDGFGIWFEEDFGAEVVFWFFAHVQAESSTMLEFRQCLVRQWIRVLRQSHDKFGHPSFVMSRSFLKQVQAHFDLLRNWKISRKRCIMS